jgi:hypothetical protein
LHLSPDNSCLLCMVTPHHSWSPTKLFELHFHT